MKDLQDNDYTLIFNTASDAEYLEVMQLELDNVSHGYFSDEQHADLYDLLDWVGYLGDDNHPRIVIRTDKIDEAKKLLEKKTSIPFDILPGMVFA